MDGCEFTISRPDDSDLQAYFYSAKKKQHSINVLFVVTLDGRIIYKSPIYSGKCDDQGAFIRCGIRAKFEVKTSSVLLHIWIMVVTNSRSQKTSWRRK